MSFAEGKVAIVGVGQSEVGRRLGRTHQSLTAEACIEAVADAGLSMDDIDGLATYPGAESIQPGFGGSGATETIDALGLNVNWYSGGLEVAGQLGPVFNAALAVAAGLADHVLVFRSLTESSAQAGLRRAAVLPGGALTNLMPDWASWAVPFGARPPNIFAMMAMRYMHDYGLTREQLAQVALTARANAGLNPRAVYREPMSLDDYLGARMISWPFCLYDCDVPVDGATAIVVSRQDATREWRRPPVVVESIGSALRSRYYVDQFEDLRHSAPYDAAAMMWAGTGLRPTDVDVAELYDGFSIFTLVWLEAMGFSPLGEAGRFVEGGARVALDGDLPINTQGGQLSGGRLHGLGYVHEACIQLWGDAGERQVPGEPRTAAVGVGGGAFAGCLLLVGSD